jgi:hypothetical protein
VRAVAISLAVHAMVLALLAFTHEPPRVLPIAPSVHADPAPIAVEVIDEPKPIAPAPTRAHGGGGGGGGGGVGVVATRRSAWDDVSIGRDDDERGTGIGTGTGTGTGTGIGGIAPAPGNVLAVPRPDFSRARPARLLVPMRTGDVDDDDLFVARVTVDEGGDVVGAHMVRTHPGHLADVAESAIWTFHYDPARDDAGKAVRATFEQSFAVR